MREYNAKVDSNQPEIVAELRANGLTVVDVHACAPFDLVVIGEREYTIRVCLVEIKSPGGKLTSRERMFWGGLVGAEYDDIYLVATSAADVLRWFGR